MSFVGTSQTSQIWAIMLRRYTESMPHEKGLKGEKGAVCKPFGDIWWLHQKL